ncbi:MAG: transcription antitermination factor NusB [Chloroflexi bacterium]|nr:transcription antitermination factor NusB [Chloroflexota bacterium]MBM3183604.1 transcription antitermination factor NusB [Chloroflexota bacterium]MBM4452648.1 transcription antitermination factor NusB [Chloroflexota bacterium]MBM4453992.1 transcription antitermination factor NusB [Chloroflexota bacterium]
MGSIGPRRKARVVALQTLYEADCSMHAPEAILNRLLAEKSLPSEASDFSKRLVAGVFQNKQEIDSVIQCFAPAFPLAQIAVIDRNILRLAIFEILFDNKAPVKVVINEAVELAKNYGGEASSKLVNGVLGTIVTNRAKCEELQQEGKDCN